MRKRDHRQECQHTVTGCIERKQAIRMRDLVPRRVEDGYALLERDPLFSRLAQPKRHDGQFRDSPGEPGYRKPLQQRERGQRIRENVHGNAAGNERVDMFGQNAFPATYLDTNEHFVPTCAHFRI